MLENPFTPEPGTRPRVMVGSGERMLRVFAREISALAERCERGTARPVVVGGRRWTGKHAVVAGLRDLSEAGGHGFVEVSGAGPGSVVDQLVEALGSEEARDFALFEAQQHERSGKGRALWEGGPRGPVALAALLVAAAWLRSSRQGGGLVVVAWDMEEASEADQEVFSRALDLLGPGEEMPPLGIVLVSGWASGATSRTMGLGHEVDEDDLGMLTEADAADLLVRTAATENVRFDQVAARKAAAWCGPLPITAQLVGHTAWEVASPSAGDSITVGDVQAATARVGMFLRERVFPWLWEEASEKERDYLRAVATLIARDGRAGEQQLRVQFAEELAWIMLENELIRRSVLVRAYPEGLRAAGEDDPVSIRPSLPGWGEFVLAQDGGCR